MFISQINRYIRVSDKTLCTKPSPSSIITLRCIQIFTGTLFINDTCITIFDGRPLIIAPPQTPNCHYNFFKRQFNTLNHSETDISYFIPAEYPDNKLFTRDRQYPGEINLQIEKEKAGNFDSLK